MSPSKIFCVLVAVALVALGCKKAPPQSTATKCQASSGDDGDGLRRWVRVEACNDGATYSVTCERKTASESFKCTCRGNGGSTTFSSAEFHALDGSGHVGVAAMNGMCGWDLELSADF